jgi:cyclophilin family peptidyl-prolyl cis-trans isomerase
VDTGLKNERGTLSMANRGPNTGTAQFFVNLKHNAHLDGKHAVFGKVIDGMDIVDKISKVETGKAKFTVAIGDDKFAQATFSDVPLDPVVIKSIKVVKK